jgi:hypothetical protein
MAKRKVGDKLKYVGVNQPNYLTPGKIYSISEITYTTSGSLRYWFEHDNGNSYWINDNHSENYVFLENDTETNINFLDILKGY